MTCESIDWGTLRDMLAESSLSIEWRLVQTASGTESLEHAPTTAFFVWKKEGDLEWSLELTEAQLQHCISRLEAEGASVPKEFLDAGNQFSGRR